MNNKLTAWRDFFSFVYPVLQYFTQGQHILFTQCLFLNALIYQCVSEFPAILLICLKSEAVFGLSQYKQPPLIFYMQIQGWLGEHNV